MNKNTHFEIDELPLWITIESVGSENIYFTYEEDGKEKNGYFKYC